MKKGNLGGCRPPGSAPVSCHPGENENKINSLVFTMQSPLCNTDIILRLLFCLFSDSGILNNMAKVSFLSGHLFFNLSKLLINTQVVIAKWTRGPHNSPPFSPDWHFQGGRLLSHRQALLKGVESQEIIPPLWQTYTGVHTHRGSPVLETVPGHLWHPEPTCQTFFLKISIKINIHSRVWENWKISIESAKLS